MQIECSCCKAAREVRATPRGNPRPPRGWRVVGGETLCKRCFGTKYAVRALTVPVVGMSDGYLSDLWDILREQWSETTALANWASRELWTRDTVRTPDMDKFPKPPHVYLYGLARDNYHRWGILPSSSASAVLRRVEADWRADRYGVIWLSDRSPRKYKYPVPWSTNAFRVGLDDTGRLFVSAKIGTQRRTLLLSRERGFRRQLISLKELAAGTHDRITELVLYYRPASIGDHRQSQQAAGKHWRIFAKVICVLPLTTQETAGTMYVRTDRDSLVLVVDARSKPVWVYHADHARRLVSKHIAHLKRLQKFQDDAKTHCGVSQHRRRSYREMLARVSAKDCRRIKSVVHEAAAALVNYASKKRFSSVEYNDDERGFAESFNWHELRRAIQSRCHAHGIGFCPCGQ